MSCCRSCSVFGRSCRRRVEPQTGQRICHCGSRAIMLRYSALEVVWMARHAQIGESEDCQGIMKGTLSVPNISDRDTIPYEPQAVHRRILGACASATDAARATDRFQQTSTQSAMLEAWFCNRFSPNSLRLVLTETLVLLTYSFDLHRTRVGLSIQPGSLAGSGRPAEDQKPRAVPGSTERPRRGLSCRILSLTSHRSDSSWKYAVHWHMHDPLRSRGEASSAKCSLVTL